MSNSGDTRTLSSPYRSVPRQDYISSLHLPLEKLKLEDPLLGLISRFFGVVGLDFPSPAKSSSAYRVFLWTCLAYALLTLLPGLAISVFHDVVRNEALVAIYDHTEWPFALFMYLVAVPVVWAYYIWQPRAVDNAIHGLDQYGVLGKEAIEKWASGLAPVAFPGAWVLSIVASTVTLGLAVVYAGTSRVGFILEATPETNSTRWFDVNGGYFVVWIILVFVPCYLAIWILFRHLYVVANLRRLFAIEHALVPRPFHPDDVNGMSPLIDYVVRVTSFIAVGGVWAFTLSVQTSVAQGNFEPQSWWLGLLAAYVLILGLVFSFSLWDAHLAMNRAKAAELEEFAGKIRSTVDDLSPQGTELLDELCKRYQLLQDQYREWPIPRVELALAAIIPVILFVGSFIQDLVRSWN